MTPEEMVATAIRTRGEFPRLSERLSDEAIRRSVAATWPDPPATLIYWLWMAGSGFAAREPAWQSLVSLEQVLAVLEDGRFVRGPWQRRFNRLRPPHRKTTYEDFSNFRSTLFELVAAIRLVTNTARVTLGPEGRTPGYDLTVEESGTPLVGVELYGPQKGVREMYQREIAGPWRRLLRGEEPHQTEQDRPRDLGLAVDAGARAIANILTDGNFRKQKAKQLDEGSLPTLLMIRSYGLTPRMEELITLGMGDKPLSDQISAEAWAELPSQCRGLLVAFTGDLVQQAVAGASPVLFVPVPGHAIDDALWSYLRTINSLTNAMVAAGRPP